jgi:hypothetical protein
MKKATFISTFFLLLQNATNKNAMFKILEKTLFPRFLIKNMIIRRSIHTNGI